MFFFFILFFIFIFYLIFDQWWIALRFVTFVAFFVLFSETNGHSNVSEGRRIPLSGQNAHDHSSLNTEIQQTLNIEYIMEPECKTYWRLKQQATERWIWKIFIKMILKYSSRKQKKCETLTKLLWRITKEGGSIGHYQSLRCTLYIHMNMNSSIWKCYTIFRKNTHVRRMRERKFIEP